MARISLLLSLLSLAALGFQGASAAAAAVAGKGHNGKDKDCGGPGGGKPIGKRTAQEVIAQLGLAANPEHGYFRETFRDELTVQTMTANGTSVARSASTAIYYLLEGAVGHSLWHRIDAAEVWHWYAGAPLTLQLSRDDGAGVRDVVLGPDVFAGQQPHVVIGSWEWQRARSHGDWTLVGTTGELYSSYFVSIPSGQKVADGFVLVAPAFDPAYYEIAEADWMPN